VTSFVNFSSNGWVLSAKGFHIDGVTTVYHKAFLDTYGCKNGRRKDDWQNQQDLVNHVLEGPPVNGETSLSTFVRLWNFSNGKIIQKSSGSQSINTEDSVSLLKILFIAMKHHGTPAGSLQALLYLVARFLGMAQLLKKRKS
jgi:hypothetical protein